VKAQEEPSSKEFRISDLSGRSIKGGGKVQNFRVIRKINERWSAGKVSL